MSKNAYAQAVTAMLQNGEVPHPLNGLADPASKDQPRPMVLQPFQSRIDGKWRVRIVGANGEKVMTSEAYSRKNDATRAANRLVAAGKQGFTLRAAKEGR